MNLYNYHSNPGLLTRYDDREIFVPQLIINRAHHLGRRIPESEPYILRSPKYTYRYARFVIRGRYPEGEVVLATNPAYACYYACNVLLNRWPLVEPIIMTRPYSAFLYAKYVIHDRWLEAEPYIRMSQYNWEMYERDVMHTSDAYQAHQDLIHANLRNWGWEV